MRPDQIRIPEPCHEDWDAMDPRARGRFCRACDKVVVDLSAMPEHEARALLQGSAGTGLCVSYAIRRDGVVRFQGQAPAIGAAGDPVRERPPAHVVPLSALTRPRPAPTRAAMVSLALAACTPHGERERERDDAEQRAIDANRAATPVTIPDAPTVDRGLATPPPAVDPNHEIRVKGDIAEPPELREQGEVAIEGPEPCDSDATKPPPASGNKPPRHDSYKKGKIQITADDGPL